MDLGIFFPAVLAGFLAYAVARWAGSMRAWSPSTSVFGAQASLAAAIFFFGLVSSGVLRSALFWGFLGLATVLPKVCQPGQEAARGDSLTRRSGAKNGLKARQAP